MTHASVRSSLFRGSVAVVFDLAFVRAGTFCSQRMLEVGIESL